MKKDVLKKSGRQKAFLSRGHKAEKFYFAAVERRAAVFGQIKSENGAVLVWVSAQKFQPTGNMCLIVSLQ